MKKTAIVTDSNSGITQKEAAEKGIYVIPMPFMISGKTFLEGKDLTKEQFYEKLQAGEEVSTSMPSAGDILDLWKKLLEEYEELVYFPMSSGLSSSYETAVMLSQEFNGKVQVVDSGRISVPLKQMVYDAGVLAKKGMDAAQIREKMNQAALDSVVYIMVDTLKYLKKGGRITPAVAAIGSLLKIKPVMKIQGGKLDIYKKTRTLKSAQELMFDALKKEYQQNWGCSQDEVYFEVAYSGVDDTEAKKWKKQLEELYPEYPVIMDPLTLSVGCHVGPGALGVGCTRRIKEAAEL